MSMLRKSAILKRKLNQDRLFCNYVHRICMQNRLEGYNYCIRHILEDKTAPFRQCSFIHIQTGKRCSNASPRSEKKECFLCPWHSKMAQRSKILAKRRQQSNISNYRLSDILDQSIQSHYMTRNSKNSDPDRPNRFLELYDSADESLSDRDLPVVENAWGGDADSDADSIDLENNDPLRHAGVYTAEEVALILRDKLISLQSLYISQFKRLHHVLSERRRNYIHSSKLESSLGWKNNSYEVPLESQKLQKKLYALQHYHKARGSEALLQKKSYDRRRAITDGLLYRHTNQPKCHFLEGGKKCTGSVVPLSKFCLKHILKDTQQVLFRPCRGPKECLKPVVPYKENVSCLIHTIYQSQDNSGDKTWDSAPEGASMSSVDITQEPELFQTMDDIAALGLDVVQPGSLFGLNQFGDLGESADSALSVDLMALNSTDILGSSRKLPGARASN